MKIIFFGSDDFAAVHLQKLIDSPYEITACVTQPDKPKGRGMKMIISPIKACAEQHNIPVLQPVDFKDETILSELKHFEADLFVVIAYGQILPKTVLDIPKIFAVNVHGSLLPQYRGAAPINWAVINGDLYTGLSIIQMNTAMDAGDIIRNHKIGIHPSDTAETLRATMMTLGPELLMKALNDIQQDQHQLVTQEEHAISFAPKLTKELGCIDWNKSAEDIYNLVRGLQPRPGAYTFFKGQQLKIWSTVLSEEPCPDISPGCVIRADKQGLLVATGDGCLMIEEVQLQSSKRMASHNFVVGHPINAGFQFTTQSSES